MPTPTLTSRRGTLLQGIIGQQVVLRAMVLRELQGRFGRHNIGYLWVIAEPMMLAASITLLHLAVSGDHESDSGTGMGVYPFTLIGYCVFIIFRNTFNRSEGLINGAATMLYHSQITPFDIVFAKALLEALAATSALIVLMALGIMAGLAQPPARALYVIAGIAAMSSLTLGVSMLISAVTYTSHSVGRLVHPFSYVMFPLSGAFFTMSFLPPWARTYMSWNPFMNIFELTRYGYFATASDKFYSPGFMIACSAVSCYTGMLALRRVRRDISIH